jgi:hypothetical protein
MPSLTLKPTYKAVAAYYDSLAKFAKLGINHGHWEAEDSAADLDKEIKHKFAIGYPKQNILFCQPDRAVLYAPK